MTEPPRTGHDSLPLAAAQAVDRVADQFDAAWRSGPGRPALEPFLTDVPEPTLSVLIRELVRIDIEYRIRHGEAPRVGDYANRFPGRYHLLSALIHEISLLPGAPGWPADGGTAPYQEFLPPRKNDERAGSDHRPPTIQGYTIFGVLGEGGMGVVYKARHAALNRLVAVKMIRPDRLPDAASRARFRAEARTVAQFDHPNIVRVFDSGESDGRPFYTMEFVPGGSLLEPAGPAARPAARPGAATWPPMAAAEVTAQLADAIEYAHRQGIVHRDLKPANVLLSDHGVPKITDFGLSKRLVNVAAANTPDGAQTKAGEPIGTPVYMAPEQADGRLDAIGPGTDIFGLGGILSFLLTGQPLFAGDSLSAILEQARLGQVVSPRSVNPEVPASLDRICMRSLAADPRQRYASAGEFAADLRRFLRGGKRVTLALAAAAVLLAVSAGLIATHWAPAELPPDRSQEQAPPVAPLPPVAPQPPASAVFDILARNCRRCHGPDGSGEGGFNFVLDRDQLINRKKVLPGKPGASSLYQRLTSQDNPMPPADELPRPTEAEVALIKAWIDGGAPAPSSLTTAPPTTLTADEVFRVVRDDLERVLPADQPYRRYFTLAPLANAGVTEDQLGGYRLALSKLVNSLSWEPRVIPPTPVRTPPGTPDGTVLRIDLRDYGWDERTWDQVIAATPYAVEHDSNPFRAVADMTRCPLPLARADWFVFAASRPPLYHTILKLPASAGELEQRLGVDVANNIRHGRVARAGFNGSGVSQNNRLLERHNSGHGAYWKSYDFAGNLGRQSLFAHPTGPGHRDRDFRHDGGEIIFNLPNGLQAYFLADGSGRRLDKGPIDIVSDQRQRDPRQRDSRRDPTVVNGISCMSCHAGGMIDKDDEVREHVEKSPAFPAEVIGEVRALYPPREAFRKLLAEDRERFAAAVRKAGASPSADPVGEAAERYSRPLTRDTAAAELGVPPDELGAAIARRRDLADAVGIMKPSGTVHRQVFEHTFIRLAEEVRVGLPLRSREIVNSIGMRFRRIPAGRFVMGSPAGEDGRSDEETQHAVMISKPFAIGVFEVTQEEYRRVTDQNPSDFSATGRRRDAVRGTDTSRFPVENISGRVAAEYCRRLSAREEERAAGRRYRLPTEAEWEYACRGKAGQTTPFHFGRTLSPKTANVDGSRPYGGGSVAPGLDRPCPVGSYPPNDFGLYDMHGNVSEWCADWWDPDFYRHSPDRDPAGPTRGEQQVLRGGAWVHYPVECRSADRRHSLLASGEYGMRVVLELSE